MFVRACACTHTRDFFCFLQLVSVNNLNVVGRDSSFCAGLLRASAASNQRTIQVKRRVAVPQRFAVARQPVGAAATVPARTAPPVPKEEEESSAAAAAVHSTSTATPKEMIIPTKAATTNDNNAVAAIISTEKTTAPAKEDEPAAKKPKLGDAAVPPEGDGCAVAVAP